MLTNAYTALPLIQYGGAGRGVDGTLLLRWHSGKGLQAEQPLYLQSATLYTNRRGERLIRVHNLKLPVRTAVAG